MSVTEINFDGLIGPSHNYAGLSLGNLASSRNAGAIAYPRAYRIAGYREDARQYPTGAGAGHVPAAMAARWSMAGAVGDRYWCSRAAYPRGGDVGIIHVGSKRSNGFPASDTADGRTHLTVANLVTMPHRSHEWPQTLAQLRVAFSDPRAFAVHAPVPAPFGDEGAANHMRLCDHHGAAGVEIFVYGRSGGPFPARQHLEASKAVARLHGLDPARTLFVEQSEEAIAAGAFHNDVVAVANERVLFAHELAFADKAGFYADLRAVMPGVEIVEVPASAVSLADAIKSYLFNAQLVTLPDGGMALILPTEAQETPTCGNGWSRWWRATGRSVDWCRWMCASPWPMAAARPACGCAWWRTRRRSTRAS